VADLGSGDIGVIGGFTSLLPVFYVNQSNSRYFSLYGASCEIVILFRLFCVVHSFSSQNSL